MRTIIVHKRYEERANRSYRCSAERRVRAWTKIETHWKMCRERIKTDHTLRRLHHVREPLGGNKSERQREHLTPIPIQFRYCDHSWFSERQTMAITQNLKLFSNKKASHIEKSSTVFLSTYCTWNAFKKKLFSSASCDISRFHTYSFNDKFIIWR